MGIISTLFIGIVCGALARVFLPGKHDMGLIATTFLGVVGSLSAGVVGVLLGIYPPGQGAGLIASIIGAIAVLWSYEWFVRQNPGYPKEVETKFKHIMGQFKSASKNAAAGVDTVKFKDLSKDEPKNPAPDGELKG